MAACSKFHFAKELSMTSLRQRMTEDMQVRNLALNTQTSYVQQVSLFARHFNKSPELLGPEDIRAYQVYLTNEKKLAPGSVLIAVSALRFLYKVSLKKDWISRTSSRRRRSRRHCRSF
jgi:integrase/recombinase XerD